MTTEGAEASVPYARHFYGHRSHEVELGLDHSHGVMVRASRSPPPPMPTPNPEEPDRCTGDELRVLVDCDDDFKHLQETECSAERPECCPDQHSNEEAIECLDEFFSRLSSQCRTAMHRYTECEEPRLVLPMEVASVLLLATAAVVLSCTLVRCCCRHFCAPMPNATSGIHLDESAELSDASDDEAQRSSTSGGGGSGTSLATPTPRPAAAKQEPPKQEPAAEEEEDALPAYQQVSS